MKKLSRVLSFLILLLSNAAFSQATDSAKNLPNILLITVDTLRADHLSCYGYHLKTSPRIDQLASEGVRFDQAYSPIPLTGPAHISLFTSRYPQEHGARINGVAVPEDSKWLFLPQILRRFGYHNLAYISAWPLTARLCELDRWFDVYDEDLTRTYQLFNSSRYAEDVTPRVISYLNGYKDTKPFFLWVHYFDPHSPYHLRKEFANPANSGHPATGIKARNRKMRNRIQKYDSEIGYTDHYIGQLLDSVDRLGLRDSTLVVLTSDHGESLGEHGYVGHGRQLYEGIIKIPLIIRYPGIVAPGEVVHQRVTLLDIAPTILDLTVNKNGKDDNQIPAVFVGRSLAEVVEKKGSLPERPIRYLTFAGKKGWMPGWLSWMWVGDDRMPLRMGETNGSRKLVWTPHQKSLSIIELGKDPLEANPLVVKKKSAHYEEGTGDLAQWFQATDLTEADARLTERDAEVLKSLGYTQ